MKRSPEAAGVTIDRETIQRIQHAAGLAVDPYALERARSSLSIPLGQLRSVVNAGVRALEPDGSEALASFAGALVDAEVPEADLVPEWWVMSVGTARRRARRHHALILAFAVGASSLSA